MPNPIPAAVREAVYERDAMRCQRCRRPVYQVGAWSVHHRQPRGMGGTRHGAHRLSVLVLVCGTGTTGCHGWIESNRAAARELGWLISKFDPADPQTIPLRWPDVPTATCLLDDGTKLIDLPGSAA